MNRVRARSVMILLLAVAASGPAATVSSDTTAPVDEAVLPEPSIHPRTGVRWYRDVPYRNGVGTNPQKHVLDLYLPAEADWMDGRPLLVWIHGGGWIMGDKDDAFGVYGRYCRRLAEAGIASANVSYRLSPPVTHPGHIEDIAAAIAWLAGRADQLGFEPEAVFVSGHSAGGHLAALIAVDEQYLQRAEIADVVRIRGAIPSSGVFDLTTLFTGVSPLAPFTRSNAADASPISHVESGNPPFLFINESFGDYLRNQALDMHRALREAGVSSEWVEIADSNHITMLGDLVTESSVHVTRTVEFIGKVLKEHVEE